MPAKTCFVRDAPVRDLTRREWTGGASDPLLLGVMHSPFRVA